MRNATVTVNHPDHGRRDITVMDIPWEMNAIAQAEFAKILARPFMLCIEEIVSVVVFDAPKEK